ncbi:SCO family protein [Acetobacteraceae bacterium H6797]|nr:SCO family protein [Acetobacteraceae bacterium H6797]
MLRLIRYLLIVVILCLGGLWGAAWLWREPDESVADAFVRRVAGFAGPQGTSAPPAPGTVAMPPGVKLGGAFSLVDNTGKNVTEKDFAGRWLVVYFGYSFCPDVCPTELGNIAAAMDELGPQSEKITPVFISVDPERDRPANLNEYVALFHPRLVGLTGSIEQVTEVARRYRVYFRKETRTDNADYLMDHSSFIYLVGPDGMVKTVLRPQSSPETIAGAVRAQLRNL